MERFYSKLIKISKYGTLKTNECKFIVHYLSEKSILNLY